MDMADRLWKTMAAQGAARAPQNLIVRGEFTPVEFANFGDACRWALARRVSGIAICYKHNGDVMAHTRTDYCYGLEFALETQNSPVTHIYTHFSNFDIFYRDGYRIGDICNIPFKPTRELTDEMIKTAIYKT